MVHGHLKEKGPARSGVFFFAPRLSTCAGCVAASIFPPEMGDHRSDPRNSPYTRIHNIKKNQKMIDPEGIF